MSSSLDRITDDSESSPKFLHETLRELIGEKIRYARNGRPRNVENMTLTDVGRDYVEIENHDGSRFYIRLAQIDFIGREDQETS